jgi:hypothetical protein
MKKILLSIALCALFLLVTSASYISATTAPTCEYQNHNGCNTIANTIVEGKITLAQDHNVVGKVDITVNCTHKVNGVYQNFTRTTKSVNSGGLKGTYIVTFPQSQCIVGDKVTVIATSKDGATGTSTGTVKDFIKEKCLDLDVAIVNVVIPMVPEFGLVAGTLTVLGALGTFFFVRRK